MIRFNKDNEEIVDYKVNEINTEFHVERDPATGKFLCVGMNSYNCSVLSKNVFATADSFGEAMVYINNL